MHSAYRSVQSTYEGALTATVQCSVHCQVANTLRVLMSRSTMGPLLCGGCLIV